MNRRIFPLLSLLLLASCGSSIIVVEKGYQTAKINKASMAVLICPPEIDYSGNVEPEFGPGDQNTLILNYFKKAIAENITSKTGLSPVRVLDDPIDPVARNAAKGVKLPNGEVVQVALPASGARFNFNGFTADYVLIVDRLFIGTSLETNTYWSNSEEGIPTNASLAVTCETERTDYELSPTSNSNGAAAFSPPMIPTPQPYVPMMHTSTSKSLTCEANIAIWDNHAATLVACGHVKSTAKSIFIPIITMGTWVNVTNDFVTAIFDKTPFSRE